MNEKQFLKRINDKSNLTGSFTYKEVAELLEENERSKLIVIPRKISIFERLFKIKSKEKTFKQIIEDNFEHILRSCCDDYIGNLLIIIFNNEDTKSIVSEKSDIILKIFKERSEDAEDQISAFGYQQDKFFRELRKTPEGIEIIRRNFEDILQSIPKKNLFATAQNLKGMSDETDDILNRYLQDNCLDVAKSLLITHKVRVRTRNGKKLLLDYADTIAIIIEELLQSENVRWVDIKSLGGGSFSNVYQIGDKILKIGGERKTYNIPNHTRILQPLTRTNLINEYDNNSVFAIIEVADRTDKLENLAELYNVYKEQLYQVYKELRDDGIIWTDVRFDNVGILNKPNIPSLNGENMDVVPHSVGFTGSVKGNELGKGDMVVLDTDYIYSENSTEIEWINNGFAREFEKRWQQEQQKKLGREFANRITDNIEGQEVIHEGEENEK